METIEVNSKTLSKKIELEAFNGYVTHNSLRALATELDAVVSYNVVVSSINPVYHLVECKVEIAGKTGLEFGESNNETLDTEIAKNYPALTACKRAYDRAVIAALQLDGKVYSVEEMPQSCLNEVQTSKPEVSVASKPSSSKKKDKEKDAATTPVVKSETPVSTPTPISTEDLGNYVLPSGRHKGKTLKECYEKGGEEWMNWICNVWLPTNDTDKEMQNKARQYYESLTSVASEEAVVEPPVTEPSVETPVTESPVETPVTEPEPTIGGEPEITTSSAWSKEELENTVLTIGAAASKRSTIKEIYESPNGDKWLEYVANHQEKFRKENTEQVDKIVAFLSTKN